ncbi:uncharacterized protein with HEPN domain [Pullulanibacillus pueri]|uniref:Uncharacterized protein n=1 Tax=Pullulanibacillus pueri TaxID=1437324 RepID=A0A8J3EL78_9BACL|nr:uncharacterized protein with HEPN domain [Pullulanibacillus pueri]GGH77487.1 hypothetical protein GCM10007096_09450 [Pullulanibacillus pueri]
MVIHNAHQPIHIVHKDHVLDAVIRNSEVIGEAANKLSPELINNNPDVPWRDDWH